MVYNVPSGTAKKKISEFIRIKAHFAELSETQDYAYWDANFFPGTHKFHHVGILHMHVFSFFFFMSARIKNPGAERQINTHRSKAL